MPILSIYCSEELFQKLEKARAGKSRSSFVVSILNEELSGTEGPTEQGPETPKPEDDPLYKLKEYESKLKQCEDALAAWPDPKNSIIEEIGNELYRALRCEYRYGLRKYGLDEHALDNLPREAKDWTDEHKKRFYNTIHTILENRIANLEERVEEHKLDGVRHQRLMKLVGISLKQLREMHHNFWEDHDMRDPTVSEFASTIGTTYQKARNIISLLGHGYGFISEREKRKLEAKEEEA